MTTTEAVQTSNPLVQPAFIFGFTAPGPLLTWSWAEERLLAARNFWINTPGADGMPHCRPMWGFWVDNAFWFSSVNRQTIFLAEVGKAVMHTESGDEVVVIEGTVERLYGKANLQVISDGYREKYNHPTNATDEGVFTLEGYGGPGWRLKPVRALGWIAPQFNTATRWVFDADGTVKENPAG